MPEPSVEPIIEGITPSHWNMRPRFKSCFRKSDGVELTAQEYSEWIAQFFAGNTRIHAPYGPDDVGVHELTDTEADRLGLLDSWKRRQEDLDRSGVVQDKSLVWT